MPYTSTHLAPSTRGRRRTSGPTRPANREPGQRGTCRRTTGSPVRYQIELEALILTTSATDAVTTSATDAVTTPATDAVTTSPTDAVTTSVTGDANAAYRNIRHLCRNARSLAEVSAELALPLGTARLLITVLAENGLVRVSRPRTAPDGTACVGLIGDVLAGLRRL